MYVYENKYGTLRLANSVQRSNSLMSRNVSRPNFKVVEGEVHIGSGTYGNVYAGYSNKTMRTATALKKLKGKAKADREVAITRKIYKIVPRHVVHVLKYTKDSIQLEMYRGGALGDWLKRVKGINDDVMRIIILQVICTLYRIHQKDPSFRHNDLSLGNIFVDDRFVRDSGERLHTYKIPPTGIRTVIADFGIARDNEYDLKDNKEWEEKYGIYKGNDEMYDVHMFLNNLYVFYAYKRAHMIPLTFAFLREVLSGGYIGENSTHVRDYRLKAGSKLPYDFLMLLNHFYFSVPLLGVTRVSRKNSINSRFKMYRLTTSNIKNWGGSYESSIMTPVYDFVLKNLGGGGAPPSPNLRRNSKLSPISENGRGITHPYRAMSPYYTKKGYYRSSSTVPKKSPLTKRKPKPRAVTTGYRKKKPLPRRKLSPVKTPSPMNLEANIKEFLKNKNMSKVTVKNIRMHLEPKYKNANLKQKIKNIVDKRIMPFYKPLSPLTPIPINKRVSMFQKGKPRFEPEKVRKYLKNTGEYKNENINKYFKRFGPAPAPCPAKAPCPESRKKELLKFIEKQGVNVLPAKAPPVTGTRTAISPGGRLRLGKKLCMAYKKDELIDFAKRAKVATSGTKEDLCERLRASKFIPDQ